VAQGIGALINSGKLQNLTQEDLQWGGLAALAGAFAPVAANFVRTLITGQQQQDLQLGGIIKMLLPLLSGSQEQDLVSIQQINGVTYIDGVK
jgi:hypothetical protein